MKYTYLLAWVVMGGEKNSVLIVLYRLVFIR